MLRGGKVIGGGAGAHLWWLEMETAGVVWEIAMREAIINRALPIKEPLKQESKFFEFPNALSEFTQVRKKEWSHGQQVLEYDNTQLKVLESEIKVDFNTENREIAVGHVSIMYLLDPESRNLSSKFQ